MVTRSPLACNSLASDAATIPLPSEEVTPPVTKMNLEIDISFSMYLPLVTFGQRSALIKGNVQEVE